MCILTEAAMRRAEALANDRGVPYLTLMEQAGTAASEVIRRRYPDLSQAIILCGSGNNGGDGLVVARRLCEAGWTITVILCAGEPKTPDARQNLSALERCAVTVLRPEAPRVVEDVMMQATLMVDALLGIGLKGRPRPPYDEWIGLINASQAPVISLDLPSGVMSDSGFADALCVQAEVTVAFSAKKPAHATYPAAEYCGQVEVVPVGIAPELLREEESRITATERGDVAQWLVPRRRNTNKGDYGRLLCVVGSERMPGAAALCMRGALRSGAGLVTLASPAAVCQILASRFSEPIYCPLPVDTDGTISRNACARIGERLKQMNAVVIGCGLGHTEDTAEVVRFVIEQSPVPVVIDADGINAVAAHIDSIKNAKAPIILTPHPGEMGRLTGCPTRQVQLYRLETAEAFAKESGAVVVLKGAGTVVALPDGRLFINETGNPGMAKGGSGDLLAGLLGGLLAQGIPPERAARAAVWLHGAAGDLAAAEWSERGMLPSDLPAMLCRIFQSLETQAMR